MIIYKFDYIPVHGSMVKVWTPELPWVQAAVAPEEGESLLLFPSAQRKPGAAMHCSQAAFMKNWRALSGGLLDDLEWETQPARRRRR